MRLQPLICAAILCGNISSVVNAGVAQNIPAQQSTEISGTTQAVQQVTNADIIEMLQAGISDRIIIAAIAKGPTNFDTSTDALVALKKAGASEALLTAVINTPRFSAQSAMALPPAGAAVLNPTMTSPGVVQQQATNGIPGMTAQPSIPPGAIAQQPIGSGSAYIPPSLMQPPVVPTAKTKQSGTASPLLSDCMNPSLDSAEQAEAAILLLVNNERQKQGSAKLNSSDPLAAVARQHSCRMAQGGFLDHVDPQYGNPAQRLQSAGLHVKSVAENLSEDSGPDPIGSAFQEWMADPDHRGNVLDSSFACTGVGVAIEPDGTYIVTELFTPAPCVGAQN
jgi:uncharacterized protein YkwD